MKNKQLKKKVNNIYETLVTKLEKIENFTLEQAPEVCKEIIEAEKIETENYIISGAMGIVCSLLVGTILFFIHSIPEMDLPLHVVFGIADIFSAIAFFYGISEVVNNGLYLRVIKASPKLIILKKLKRLIN